MKKLIALILMLVMLSSVAVSEKTAERLDFSKVSYGYLLLIQQWLTEEIMSRPEWKSVTIPGGTWKVGEDIPAGTYSIQATANMGVVIWEKAVDDYSGRGPFLILSMSEGEVYGKAVLEEGNVIDINKPIILGQPLAPQF